ncbi:MAG: HK97 family phage prohead protease, partial [Lachnospiraceae bacterium]|nr:HK97 family phage prohead protease [Lachnospiraceae bacterium]
MSKRSAPAEGRFSRELTVKSIRAKEGEGNERRFILSFSSEEPYERWWGTEILDHSDGCVDLTRVNEIGCVLFNHNRDAVIGKVIRAWIKDGRGLAEIEIDSDEESEKIYQKIKSGTLKGVSVGYAVYVWEDVAANKKSSDGRFDGAASIAKRWEVYEISIVSVPADPTVGVGREKGNNEQTIQQFERQLSVNKNMIGGSEKEMEKRAKRQQKIMRQQALLDAAKSQHRE